MREERDKKNEKETRASVRGCKSYHRNAHGYKREFYDMQDLRARLARREIQGLPCEEWHSQDEELQYLQGKERQFEEERRRGCPDEV